MTQSLSLKQELERKAIHLISLAIPLFYAVTHRKGLVIDVLLILSTGFLTVDILRMKFPLVRRFFLHIFGSLLREKEARNRLTGATTLWIGMLLTVVLFAEKPAIVGMLFVILADPAAAIVGRMWGKNAFWGKTLEGAAAFYLIASAIILLFTKYSWGGLITALIMTVIEFLPIGIDDNLLIPVVTAYLLTVM